MIKLALFLKTNTIGIENEVVNVDDIIETTNHFSCIDMIIDHVKMELNEKFIKVHFILKNGTSDSKKDSFCRERLQKISK